MLSPSLLLKTATILSRLSKASPVCGRQLRRLSTLVAIKAVSKAVQECEETPACVCGRGCGRGG